MGITARQLLTICVVASVCAVTVVLVMHALGLGEHAVIAAAVSASTASVAASQSMEEPEAETETN